MKKIFKFLVSIIVCLLLIIAVYVFYMQSQYYRIEDNLKLEIVSKSDKEIELDKKYSAMTFNIGYGAYSHEFSFFLDSATIAETNQKVSGKYGKGISRQDVLKNTEKTISILKENPVDFYLLQEVDEKADRSYNINQVSKIKESFNKYDSVFANNFHTGFLALPLHDMHGRAHSGLLSLSAIKIDDAVRKSYPVTDDFFIKFTDLDRCFKVLRYQLKNGKQLVLINSHMSAYDEGGVIRKKQLELLNQFLKTEKEKGNYVVVGGDFNHDYCDSKKLYPGNKTVAEWISVLKDSDLSQGFRFIVPENRLQTGTCRGAEEPYNKNTTYQSIVDGFIVSDNIEAQARIIDMNYISSDHQPVILEFKLKKN